MLQVGATGKEEELTLLAEIYTSQQHNKLCRFFNPLESDCLRLHCLNILGWLWGTTSSDAPEDAERLSPRNATPSLSYWLNLDMKAVFKFTLTN
jgi:hypothetical protein